MTISFSNFNYDTIFKQFDFPLQKTWTNPITKRKRRTLQADLRRLQFLLHFECSSSAINSPPPPTSGEMGKVGVAGGKWRQDVGKTQAKWRENEGTVRFARHWNQLTNNQPRQPQNPNCSVLHETKGFEFELDSSVSVNNTHIYMVVYIW